MKESTNNKGSVLVTPRPPVPLGVKQWDDLKRLHPSDVCRRSLAPWDGNGFYSLSFLGTVFRIYPEKEIVDSETGDLQAKNPEFKLLLLCYLLYAQDVPLQSRWVSEKELKGGSMFFTGTHSLPSESLIKLFGNDPDRFISAGKSIGGRQLPGYGDAALVFTMLPRVPCGCVLWAGDAEFPARVTFLFDASVEAHLPLDIINPLVRYLVKSLVLASASGTNTFYGKKNRNR